MLDILLMVVSVILILLSLLQSGKSDGISGAFTGSGGLNLFANVKERGPEKIFRMPHWLSEFCSSCWSL